MTRRPASGRHGSDHVHGGGAAHLRVRGRHGSDHVHGGGAAHLRLLNCCGHNRDDVKQILAGLRHQSGTASARYRSLGLLHRGVRRRFIGTRTASGVVIVGLHINVKGVTHTLHVRTARRRLRRESLRGRRERGHVALAAAAHQHHRDGGGNDIAQQGLKNIHHRGKHVSSESKEGST